MSDCDLSRVDRGGGVSPPWYYPLLLKITESVAEPNMLRHVGDMLIVMKGGVAELQNVGTHGSCVRKTVLIINLLPDARAVRPYIANRNFGVLQHPQAKYKHISLGEASLLLLAQILIMMSASLPLNYLRLPSISRRPSISNVSEKRSVWSSGDCCAVAIMYEASRRSTLSEKPAPMPKYWRLPLNWLS